MTKIACPACGIVDAEEKTILSVLVASPLATDKRGLRIDLTQCHRCWLYYNSSFDISSIDYQAAPWETFFNHRQFLESNNRTIQRLLSLAGSAPFPIFDFGCGDGSFLSEMKAAALRNGTKVTTLGYDIGKFAGASQHLTDDLSFFTEQLAQCSGGLMTARHVLEHLSSVNEFFDCAENFDGYVYVEVPNGAEAIENRWFEDLVYEHVSYFSYASLASMLSARNWIPRFYITSLNGENIGILAVRANRVSQVTSALQAVMASSFKKQKNEYEALARLLSDPAVGFWGVGGRCGSILDQVSRLVTRPLEASLLDSDPGKWNKYIKGFKNPVQKPTLEALSRLKIVLVGTRVGKSSIEKEIAELGARLQTCLWDQYADLQ